MEHPGRCSKKEGEDHCWRCELAERDPRYLVRWQRLANEAEADARLTKAVASYATRTCIHLGAAAGTVNDTAVHACALFGTCTPTAVVRGVRSCQGCPKKQFADAATDPLQIVVTAAGVGDHILGLCCVVGLKKKYPLRPVIYCARSWCRQWVELFSGYDILTTRQLEGITSFMPHDSYDAQNKERMARGGRVDYYAAACDNIKPEPPPVRKLDAKVVQWAEAYRNYVVLVPFPTHQTRAWLRSHWLTLETLLHDAGLDTVVLDSGGAAVAKTNGIDRPVQRCDVFRHDKLIGKSPAEVAAVLSVSSCVVSSDSGMAHLAGTLGVPTLVLCGPILGEKIFGIYPSVRSLNGPLACSGCHWHGPEWRKACDSVCASLQAISPDHVIEHVLLIQRQRAEAVSILRPGHMDVLMTTVREAAEVSGCLAELGVYKGGSSLAMSLADPQRPIYLFDTFSGHPIPDPIGHHHVGQYSWPQAEVARLMAGRPAEIVAGVFPGSSAGLEGLQFAVVHIDVNLYDPTSAAVDFFWPRLSAGGFLIFDDYQDPGCPGVTRVVHERFTEAMIKKTGQYQCRVQKPRG